MARDYIKQDASSELAMRRRNIFVVGSAGVFATLFVIGTGFSSSMNPTALALLGGILPTFVLLGLLGVKSAKDWVESERTRESKRRDGKPVLGLPPNRDAVKDMLAVARQQNKIMLDKYLIGFEVNSGEPIWIGDDELCTHAAVFAKTGVGKTLWLESIMFQQMARGRASGFTFIDAKRDMGTLADIIIMALLTGRIEDLIVVDPFDPVCCYNFVFTTQRADVKARKVLRCGLPPTSDQSTTKHYDRLAADSVYRVVRAMESLGLSWSVRDIAVALSAFNFAYPRLRQLLHERGAKQAMIELGHLAGSYRSAGGKLQTLTLTDNLRGISSELHSISNSEAGEMFCAPRADLSLTDAILRGKLIYYMLPRLEEAESAARMVKVFREDLEVSIGEITSNRNYRLEDPHLVIVDEGASTFGPTWANLFELARKGRFALLFGAQSVGGLMDETMGLSEQFYERVLANVNLKVIMRVGDNRTAMDMSEWIGTIKVNKKSFGVGLSSGVSAHELTKNIELNRRSADATREAITVAEDEEELVSPEELKHEMSAEKGLAWFDLGDGRLRKGRSLWFNSDLPGSWEGREYLCRYESVEADEVGLADWVDEHILSVEQADAVRDLSLNDLTGGNAGDSGTSSNPMPRSAENSGSQTVSSGMAGGKGSAAAEEEEGGAFRFNLMRGFRGKPRARTFVGAVTDEPTSVSAERAPLNDPQPTTEQSATQSAKQSTTQSTTQSASPPNRAVDLGASANQKPAVDNKPGVTEAKKIAEPTPPSGEQRQRADLKPVIQARTVSFKKEGALPKANQAPEPQKPQERPPMESAPTAKTEPNPAKPQNKGGLRFGDGGKRNAMPPPPSKKGNQK